MMDRLLVVIFITTGLIISLVLFIGELDPLKTKCWLIAHGHKLEMRGVKCPNSK